MGWLGAGLGALLGARGGILTSLACSALGSWVEEKIKSGVKGNGTASVGAESQRQELLLLAALAAMLAKLAKADGRITRDEVRYCEGVFDRLGLRGEKRTFCINVFRSAKDDARSIVDYAASFTEQQPEENVRVIVYDILWDLACVDGVVSRNERLLLAQVVRPLRIPSQLFAWQCRRRGVSAELGDDYDSSSSQSSEEPARDPYEVIGCARRASDDEVRAAYREKAKRLHPDILRAQGLSEELLGRANEQMARINAAWAEIRRERNI